MFLRGTKQRIDTAKLKNIPHKIERRTHKTPKFAGKFISLLMERNTNRTKDGLCRKWMKVTRKVTGKVTRKFLLPCGKTLLSPFESCRKILDFRKVA